MVPPMVMEPTPAVEPLAGTLSPDWKTTLSRALDAPLMLLVVIMLLSAFNVSVTGAPAVVRLIAPEIVMMPSSVPPPPVGVVWRVTLLPAFNMPSIVLLAMVALAVGVNN